ncbi:hypothetical protein [Sediminibacterium soli]|uniref:hypothetical protein n=1 Tax=Sediminibacterium soli TaxID=2698829 RepID=UPI00137A41BA|nr:hypothetical protein [Sediminibacterium soli]NCI45428.1 hypothetical protein [Sediminibacterium soli]
MKKNKGLKELIFKNSQKAVIDGLRIKDDIYYGNYWILFNDGCYYLFAAYYNVETNVTELRPMNFFNYATAYQKCMPPDEWAAFC